MKKKVIMSSRDIDLAIQRITLQILEKNHDLGRLSVVGIHTCGVYVAAKIHAIIAREAGNNVSFGTLDINLYRDDWSLTSQNPIVKTSDISFDVEGTNLILVDDVLFTGRTIRAAMDAILDYGRPQSIELAVLIDRGSRELPIQPDFTGMQVVVLHNEKINVRLSRDGGDGEVVIER